MHNSNRLRSFKVVMIVIILTVLLHNHAFSTSHSNERETLPEDDDARKYFLLEEKMASEMSKWIKDLHKLKKENPSERLRKKNRVKLKQEYAYMLTIAIQEWQVGLKLINKHLKSCEMSQKMFNTIYAYNTGKKNIVADRLGNLGSSLNGDNQVQKAMIERMAKLCDYLSKNPNSRDFLNSIDHEYTSNFIQQKQEKIFKEEDERGKERMKEDCDNILKGYAFGFKKISDKLSSAASQAEKMALELPYYK